MGMASRSALNETAAHSQRVEPSLSNRNADPFFAPALSRRTRKYSQYVEQKLQTRQVRHRNGEHVGVRRGSEVCEIAHDRDEEAAHTCCGLAVSGHCHTGTSGALARTIHFTTSHSP
jgi:hypothetical protein